MIVEHLKNLGPMAIHPYFIALFFHILFVFTWLSVLVVDLLLERIFNDVRGTDSEKSLFKYTAWTTPISIIAGLGILLTGGYMVESASWGWFPFQDYLWLAVKQVLWILLFIGGGIVMAPLHNQLKSLLTDDGSIEEMREIIKKMNFRSRVLSIVIVANIFLAITKPI